MRYIHLFVILVGFIPSLLVAGGPACFPYEACRFTILPQPTQLTPPAYAVSPVSGAHFTGGFTGNPLMNRFSPEPSPVSYLFLGATAGALNGWAAAEIAQGHKSHPDTYFSYFPYSSYAGGSPSFWYYMQ